MLATLVDRYDNTMTNDGHQHTSTGDESSHAHLLRETHRRRCDRVHAVFAIAHGLDAIGLATWTHPLLTLLGRYDGIEEYAWDDDPVPVVLQLVEGYVAAGRPVSSGTVAEDLVQLQVLHYRAAWFKPGEVQACLVWDPLTANFLQFIEQPVEGAEWRIWKVDEPNPDRDLVKRYLLADYVRVNGFR